MDFLLRPDTLLTLFITLLSGAGIWKLFETIVTTRAKTIRTQQSDLWERIEKLEQEVEKLRSQLNARDLAVNEGRERQLQLMGIVQRFEIQNEKLTEQVEELRVENQHLRECLDNPDLLIRPRRY